MSHNDRRVAIAKDVIAQLEIKRYVPNQGRWCSAYSSIDHMHGVHHPKFEENTELQPVLNESVCEVCALGAVFASAVGLYNNWKVTPATSRGRFHYNDIEIVLENYFDPIQLMAMEIAFEVGDGGSEWRVDDTDDYDVVRDDTMQDAADAVGYEIDDETVETLFDRSMIMGSVFPDITERMIAIMRNVIQHNGEFKP